MLYILLDNLDQGLELAEVESFVALFEYLRKHKELEGDYDRIHTIIFGEEVPWEVVKQYFHL